LRGGQAKHATTIHATPTKDTPPQIPPPPGTNNNSFTNFTNPVASPREQPPTPPVPAPGTEHQHDQDIVDIEEEIIEENEEVAQEQELMDSEETIGSVIDQVVTAINESTIPRISSQ
jgi:hypothetical protein